MGMLVNGEWQLSDAQAHGSGVHRENQSGQFRHWIGEDPRGLHAAGQAMTYPAQAGRYHLVVSSACPNCHRLLIMRRVKRLHTMVSVSVTNPVRTDQGWHFGAGHGVIPDPIMGAQYVHQLYSLAQADYTGRASVPILWDRESQSIVSNESGDIMQMFNSAFNDLGADSYDYYPNELQAEIDTWNDKIFHTINDGVYRAGLSQDSVVYRRTIIDLFQALDEIESTLSENDYLLGNHITLADWRLWVSLVRFDAVYYPLFYCNVRRMVDYPHIRRYIQRLYCLPGVAETFDLKACKLHYFLSYPQCNPRGLVPLGPSLDFTLKA
ncbi:MAG: glutathione S-transferase C-terminal domain-containing protein [Xanthomonadales bacterium]|nr:glutathione S-transferase C-terminal domain-containing protein [Xanthomonadales bacterium]